eukprot:1014318-Prorocentrum_lima.AAC.1
MFQQSHCAVHGVDTAPCTEDHGTAMPWQVGAVGQENRRALPIDCQQDQEGLVGLRPHHRS